MLSLYRSRPKVAGFLTSEKDHPTRPLCVSLKHSNLQPSDFYFRVSESLHRAPQEGGPGSGDNSPWHETNTRLVTARSFLSTDWWMMQMVVYFVDGSENRRPPARFSRSVALRSRSDSAIFVEFLSSRTQSVCPTTA